MHTCIPISDKLMIFSLYFQVEVIVNNLIELTNKIKINIQFTLKTQIDKKTKYLSMSQN